MRPSPGRYMYRPAGSCMHDPERGAHVRLARPIVDQRDRRSASMRPLEQQKELGVQRRLFLRGWERPRRPRAALLAKDEAQLLGRRKLRLVRPESGAGLSQLQRTQQVAPEIALIARYFAGSPLALRPRH